MRIMKKIKNYVVSYLYKNLNNTLQQAKMVEWRLAMKALRPKMTLKEKQVEQIHYESQ